MRVKVYSESHIGRFKVQSSNLKHAEINASLWLALHLNVTQYNARTLQT